MHSLFFYLDVIQTLHPNTDVILTDITDEPLVIVLDEDDYDDECENFHSLTTGTNGNF